MDVNGFKGPNSEARNGKQYDIRSFKVAKFSKGCAGKDINGIGCVYQLPSYSPIKAGTEDMKKYDPKYDAVGYTDDNYWAGAKKACDELGMSLPDPSKLYRLYQAAKKDSSFLGFPAYVWFWTSEEGRDGFAFDMYFNEGRMYHGLKSGSSSKALCVGD